MLNTSQIQPVVRRRSAEAKAPPARPLPRWIDWVVLAFAATISFAAIYYTVQAGAFSTPLSSDSLWAWHLVRACGMVSFTLMAASTLWGVFLASRVIKDWSPGPLSLLLHATTSWLAVLFAIAHVGLLLFDSYYHFTLPDLLVPFGGPYRPIPVGIGIIGQWLIIAITLSFSFRKLIGQRAWQCLHYTSYAAFGLLSVHALLAGTDSVQAGLRIILGLFTFGVIGLMIMRITQVNKRRAVHA
jgi:sulfoxide reductase heme-binding subunit YedZ